MVGTISEGHLAARPSVAGDVGKSSTKLKGRCTEELEGQLFIAPMGGQEDQFQITSPESVLGLVYTRFASRKYKS